MLGDMQGHRHARTRHDEGRGRPSRRTVLGGAALGATGTAWAALNGGAADAALPRVRPLPSHYVFQRMGVNAQPNFAGSEYEHVAQWMERLNTLGVSYFRGFYSENLPVTGQVVRLARRYKIKWGMTVASGIDTPNSEIQRRIAHIARHASDRCLWIEGINEPDWDRRRGRRPPGWEARCLEKQRVIWKAVRSHRSLRRVKVLGPSLRDVSATEADYRHLAERGMLRHFNFAAIHRYPNGTYPDQFLAERRAMIKRQWPGKKIWITETGYHNAVANTTQQKPVPEYVAAAYAPSALLEAVDRGYHGVLWYELLDEPDPGPKNLVESNFGLLATGDTSGPPWRSKPAFNEIRSFLALLKDPGPRYRARRIRLRVRADSRDVRWTVTGKRNGVTHVHVRRATDCWDNNAQRPIAVRKVQVVIRTPGRTRRIMVDHRVTSVRIR